MRFAFTLRVAPEARLVCRRFRCSKHHIFLPARFPELSGGQKLNSEQEISLWERSKDRFLTAAFLILLLYSAFRSFFKAATRPLWFDELLTSIVARQPTISSLWRALAHCVDSQPPPYYLLQRFFGHLVSNEQIAFRIASILGFCVMQWCLFVFLKKRHDISIAFVACLLPLMTTLFATYSVEARPYALEIAFLAIALVAYQRASTPFWVFVLALSLMAAESTHYYALFVVASLFVAEGSYFLKTRSFRIGVWIALCSGLLPLVIFWPLLSHFKECYGAHVWYGTATLVGTLKIYGWLFGVSTAAPGAAPWTTLVILLLPAAILLGVGMLLFRSLRAKTGEHATFHLDILVAGILLTPLVMLFATKLNHTGLIPRYLLPTILGVALGAGYGLSLLSKKVVGLVGVLLLFCIAIQEVGFWFSYYEAYQLGLNTQPYGVTLIQSAGHSELPVVVSEGHDYLELNHYAPRAVGQRLVFVAAPDAAIAHNRTDTNDRNLLILRDFAPLRVIEYAKLRDARIEFLLYSDPTLENDPDWFVAWLSTEGWSLHELKSDGHATVFLVEPPR